MTNPTTVFDRALEQFKRDMKWSPQATEVEKTLVLGNLSGFVALLNKQLLETTDAEMLAAVSPEDLTEGHRIVKEAIRAQSNEDSGHHENDQYVIARAQNAADAPYDQDTCRRYPWAAAARIKYLEGVVAAVTNSKTAG